MDDKLLICSQCGKDFLFTIKDQQYFAGKGYAEPKRCKRCRQKITQRDSKVENQNNGRFEKKNSFRKKFESPYSRVFWEKYPVTCSKCGLNFEVQNKPLPSEKIFCRECKIKKGSNPF